LSLTAQDVLQGRWYAHRVEGGLDLERYLDIRGDHFFLAEQFHKGGPYKTRQAVLTLSAKSEGEGRILVDLQILRLMQDGKDRSPEYEGMSFLALCRREKEGLLLALGEPEEPRPRDFSSAELYQKKG
jgi:hypothetical protein